MNNAESQEKKISANDAIIGLLSAINNDKLDVFYKTASEYASTLSPNGNVRYRLRNLIDSRPRKLINLSDLPRDIKGLLSNDEKKNDVVFLTEDIKVLISGLLREWDNISELKFHNLSVRNKLLLHGPTGTGKTTIARYIASVSNLPFINVTSDMVVDSKLGNTSANIYNIFNQLNVPCVLFWDEVDTIGRARGKGSDTAAGLENERMVNSILVNLEKMSDDVVFIGATNRMEVLDSAFTRRFDVLFELPNPSVEQMLQYSTDLKNYYRLPDLLCDIDDCKNFSEVKNKLSQQARRQVLGL